MRIWGRAAALMFGAGIAASSGFACKCSGVHGRTAWETAEKEEKASSAIFEAAAERFEMHWDELTAKSGAFIPLPDLSRPDIRSEQLPRMMITFRVKRVYKGNLGTTVRVSTGMGGGDCGSQYAPGLDYLVYAYGATSAELTVDMCSPGGWLGSNYLATELRHLRKERPTRDDLAKLEYWTPSDVARRDRERQEFDKRFTTATGQICGTVSPPTGSDSETAVRFLPTIGYSPYWSVTTVGQDGKFCSDRLGPGQYYMYFTRGPWREIRDSALFYPGVTERSRAAVIKIEAGQVKSDITFRIPKNKVYVVRGLISVDDKTGIGPNGVVVVLCSRDGLISYHQTIDFRSSFPLPRTKYFSIGDVLSGQYVAFAFSPGKGWLTKVADVNVTAHAAVVFLTLKHAPAAGAK